MTRVILSERKMWLTGSEKTTLEYLTYLHGPKEISNRPAFLQQVLNLRKRWKDCSNSPEMFGEAE